MNDNIIILIISIFVSIFTAIVIIAILFAIFVFIVSPIQDKQQKKIEIKLNEKLINICSMFGIPLEYKEDLGEAAGRILYHSNGFGRLILDNCRIEVLEQHKERPYVLAHELGHYIAIKKYQDDSEEMADKMGGELCYNLLSEKEREILKISLDIYFNRKQKKKDFERMWIKYV